MLAMQYRFVLPADYDMAIIRQRIHERGHLLDGFPIWNGRPISGPNMMSGSRAASTPMRRSTCGGITRASTAFFQPRFQGTVRRLRQAACRYLAGLGQHREQCHAHRHPVPLPDASHFARSVA
jgi:hypothetical protein